MPRRPGGLQWLTVAAFVVAAAASQPVAAQSDALSLDVRGLWRVEQAQTEPIYDRALARLDFSPSGRLTGHTSCNTLSADYTLQGDRLQVGVVTTTRAPCTARQLEQEDRILTALEMAATARVRPDGLLELRAADGRGVLRATRLMPTL